MIGARSNFGRYYRPTQSSMRGVAVLCLILLALLTVVQVTHVHEIGTDADHCQLCVVIHSVVPLLMLVTALLLVRIVTVAPALVEVRPIVRYWHPTLFTRPPPAGL